MANEVAAPNVTLVDVSRKFLRDCMINELICNLIIEFTQKIFCCIFSKMI